VTGTSGSWSRTAAHPKPGSRAHRPKPLRVIPETPRPRVGAAPTALVPGVMVRR
jgi:hypothetical protein